MLSSGCSAPVWHPLYVKARGQALQLSQAHWTQQHQTLRRAQFGPKYAKDLNGWFDTPRQEREFWKITKGCGIAKGLSCLNHCSSFIKKKKGINSFQFLVDLKLPISELSQPLMWFQLSMMQLDYFFLNSEEAISLPPPSSKTSQQSDSNQTWFWLWLIVDINPLSAVVYLSYAAFETWV